MKIGALLGVIVTGARMADLESFHGYLIDTASKIVAAGKEVERPLIFVLTRDGRMAILPPPPSKDNLVQFQKSIVREPVVRACAVVFEAWTSSRVLDMRKTNPGFMPVDDPQRTEAIIVSIMTTGRQSMTVSPIERPANVVHKAPFQWLDEKADKFSGRFIR